MNTLNALLGFFILVTLLSGCSGRHVNEPLQNTTAVHDKQESPDSVRVHPLGDAPDDPSPHNPLIKKFGDIPEVHTYTRLKPKLERGIGLTIDEAIEFYTAEVHLYPTPAAKEMLKDLKSDKRRYQRLGIPADVPVLTPGNVSKESLPPPEFVLVNPFTDDPDNPSPHNPLVKKFGDIPEVRTYIRLKQKFDGIGLNVDEVIELYTAEAYLYPSDTTRANLKRWKKDKERYERLGILTDEPVLGSTGTKFREEEPVVNEDAD